MFMWNTTPPPPPPREHKVHKAIFSMKVTDYDVILKGIISWVCMPNMKSPSLTVQQKLLHRLKLRTHRQEERRT